MNKKKKGRRDPPLKNLHLFPKFSKFNYEQIVNTKEIEKKLLTNDPECDTINTVKGATSNILLKEITTMMMNSKLGQAIENFYYEMSDEEFEKINNAMSEYFWKETEKTYRHGYNVLRKYTRKFNCTVGEFYEIIDYLTY